MNTDWIVILSGWAAMAILAAPLFWPGRVPEQDDERRTTVLWEE